MNEHEALSRMIAPGTKRPGKYRQGIIQVWITRSCDKACFACTQGSNLRGSSGFISLEHFEQACVSLKNYFGVVGIFGGNPCLHPKFPAICEILCKHIPRERRGLWSNRLMGHGKLCKKVFNPSVCNINVHCDSDSFSEIRRDWPQVRVFGLEQDSRHSPPFVALQDVVEDPDKRWELISDCDINKHWSAIIIPFRGEAKGYFCEIAGAQAILHESDPDYPDLGVPLIRDWWKRPMQEFAEQARYHCHACGIPLRIYGELSQEVEGRELVSITHKDVYLPKKKDRPVQVVNDLNELSGKTVGRIIDYLKNAKT
jgi:hypothetical protein